MLSKSCETLAGIGPTLAAKLAKCGILTIGDLIFHLPLRYQDRTCITPIRDLRANEWAVVAGSVDNIQIKYGRRPTLSCIIRDKTGILCLRFFHFNPHQVRALQTAQLVRIFGEVRAKNGLMEMVHPEYQILNNLNECTVEETLTPIYPSTAGLSQAKLRKLVAYAIQAGADTLASLEWMDEDELDTHQFYSMPEALKILHNPPPDNNIQAALKRLVFDELLAHRLSMQFARQSRLSLSAPFMTYETALEEQFIASLPFKLTKAQLRVHQEIVVDLKSHKPMLRLVQGDVGAGKTINAALAAIQALANGFQVAFMAPTELLSEQHAANLTTWLAPLGISILLLRGKMKKSLQKAVYEELGKPNPVLVVGTHAIFQEAVKFANLGLIIIDEQHRFGVEQRLMLQQKGQQQDFIPHQLIMTATPIPRTLVMTHFGHLEVSILDELPPGRSPITTAVISQDKRDALIARLQKSIAAGTQAYWVCTLIEESEKLDCQAATLTAQNLAIQLPGVRIGLIHGRMKPIEKEATMASFKAGNIDLLIATTVIEVGVDVPRASLMVIENAERLGLSQLHQLRGRVGRGSIQSHCILLYQSPLSEQGSERLQVMRDTTDGFIIAEKDLQLRGGGDILGTRQAGYRIFKIANFPRDSALVPLLSTIAKQLVQERPQIARQIAHRWLSNFEQFLQG